MAQWATSTSWTTLLPPVRREMSVQEDFLAQGSQSASVISWLEPAQLSNARVVGRASGLESMSGAHLEVHSL